MLYLYTHKARALTFFFFASFRQVKITEVDFVSFDKAFSIDNQLIKAMLKRNLATYQHCWYARVNINGSKQCRSRFMCFSLVARK